jgi:uncharacterized protein
MTAHHVQPANVLVLAKAPIAGRVKTRLGRDLGMSMAAELAAAALLDTLDACVDYHPTGCFLALEGVLDEAVRGHELRSRLTGWTVFAQVGDTFADRLAHAHSCVPGPVIQIGMDTPQISPADLAEVAGGLSVHDGVLARAADGGWWSLALRDPSAAAALRGVPMSTDHTYEDTARALTANGLSLGTAHELVDIDTVVEAEKVAAAHTGAFSRAWARRPHVGAST